jgi:lipopolysaccharide exporter
MGGYQGVCSEVKRQAVRGIGWAFTGSIASRIFQTAATLVLAKLLAPSDFGVFSLATIIINSLVLFSDMGFAQVLIYLQGDIKRSANTAFVLCSGTVAVFAALLWIGAPFVGDVFSEPSIILPIRAMAPMLVLAGANSVPAVLLDKELKFEKKALIEVPTAFAYAVTAVVLAFLNCGVWSLVAAWILMVLVSCTITWAVSPWRPTIEFGVQESKKIITYGSHLVIGVFAAFAFLQIDKLSIGKWLGMTQLGYYTIAFTVCNLPATNLTAVVNRVMFPAYSKLADIPEIRKMYLQMVRHLSVIIFPSITALFILAGPLIRIVYGSKWEGAVALFYVLAFFGLFRAFGTTSDAVFMATDNPSLIRKVNIIQLVVAGVFVYPAARFMGAFWVAVLFAAAAFTGMVFALLKVKNLLGIELSEWAGVLGAPAIATVAAGFISTIGQGEISWIIICRTFAVFALSYAGIILLLDRSLYRDMAAALRRTA